MSNMSNILNICNIRNIDHPYNFLVTLRIFPCNFQVNFLELSGDLLVTLWVPGTCVELARNLRGTCEELARDLHGTCEVLTWNLQGTCEGLASNLQRTYTWHHSPPIFQLCWKIFKDSNTNVLYSFEVSIRTFVRVIRVVLIICGIPKNSKR